MQRLQCIILLQIVDKDRNFVTPFLHRLVALVFIPNPENKPQVDHINRIKTDNSVSNLRWVTKVENGQNKDKTNIIN